MCMCVCGGGVQKKKNHPGENGWGTVTSTDDWGTVTSTGRNSQAWSPKMCDFKTHQRFRDEQNEVVHAWKIFTQFCGMNYSWFCPS